MSSTNRGSARNTHISDFYVTPQGCIKDFFDSWIKDLNKDNIFINNFKWLDPCAGGDVKHRMSYPEVIENYLELDSVGTIDIRENSLAERIEDYRLADITKEFYDVIITNPPFNIAEQIINKALEDVKSGGYVVMLLRLNFFGSNARFPFWKKQLPIWSYVHHRRMSFTDDGKTDSIEYMHAVWQKDIKPEFTKLRII